MTEPIDFNTLSEDVAGADAVFTFSDNAILNGSTPYFLCVRFEDHNGLDNFLMVTTGNGTGAGDTFVLVGATWQEQTSHIPIGIMQGLTSTLEWMIVTTRGFIS